MYSKEKTYNKEVFGTFWDNDMVGIAFTSYILRMEEV